jgi:hypothetical protein
MSCLMPPLCSFCEHYLGDVAGAEKECDAFLEIPDAIITGAYDHTKPHPDDQGILFKLNEALREDFEEVEAIKKELLFFG